MIEKTKEEKEAYIEGAKALKGAKRRLFMARIVKALGRGDQFWSHKKLGWNRETIRKGTHELESGIICVDNFEARGRKRAEELLPNLLDDIRTIVDGQSQTDPTFKTTRLYVRISARAVRQALLDKHGYSEEEMPCEETIRLKLNAMNYRPRAVQKCLPKKKIPETDAIFEHLAEVHEEVKEDERIIRISLDAKARLVFGDFSRGGSSRVPVEALDHDFAGEAQKAQLFGFHLPDHNETYLYFITSPHLTSDAMVDCLEDLWSDLETRFPSAEALLLNLDNGPENHSRRTQFMHRLVEFVDKTDIELELAYYPPYHSKYNPIERVWGVLEQHWNGSLLDCLQTALEYAKTMTYRGVRPVVKVIHRVYETGKKLTEKAMREVEKRLGRLEGLAKYFVTVYAK